MLVMAGVEYWMGASLANLSLNEWTGDAEGGDGSDLDGNGWGDYPGHLNSNITPTHFSLCHSFLINEFW